MSEQKESQEQQEQSESGSESTHPAEAGDRRTSDDSRNGSESEDGSTSRGAGNVVAWLALLLALGAAALAGWQWWLSAADDQAGQLGTRVEQQADAIESQSGRVSELGERMDGVEARLDELARQVGERDFDPAELRSQIQSQADSDAELRQQVASLSERLDQAVSNVESQLEQAGAARSDRIEDALDDARFRLGLVEIAGLLRLGQSRAELAGDPAGAVAAYQLAQSRLGASGDGRLDRLRQLVARELEALQAVEPTDWAALAGRLSALESESAQWPMAGAAERSSEEAGEVAGDADGWWSSLRASLGGLVRVTPREAAALTPAAVESVRERLRLHLAAAQAAAARRSNGELARHLEVAENLVRTHFDLSSESVSRALESISEAASADSPSLPDLGSAVAEAERRLAGS